MLKYVLKFVSESSCLAVCVVLTQADIGWYSYGYLLTQLGK